jgi:hypothetical protein
MTHDNTTVRSQPEIPHAEPWQPLTTAHRNYFLMGGLAFLGTALVLYILTGYMLFTISQLGPIITVPGGLEGATSESRDLSERDIYNFYGRILSFSLAPALCMIAAIICTIVGIRLLRSSGAVATQVISPQDYPVLGPAIAGGNEQAITQFIRLSSLSGMTGTFTKIGLTGLPLATIFLTILLAIMGLANSQFFDLAKLTLGAFLGSFVQRQSDVAVRSPTARNS